MIRNLLFALVRMHKFPLLILLLLRCSAFSILDVKTFAFGKINFIAILKDGRMIGT